MMSAILVGCLGRLGLAISNYILEQDDKKIVAGVDIKKNLTDINLKYKIYENLKEVKNNGIDADVVIDFSNINALPYTLNYCEKTNTPLVLGTTGMNDDDKNKIIKTSKHIPIFWSANMSIGINILLKLCTEVMAIANDIFEIDIIEKHHNKKLDSPSGTVDMITDLIISNSKKLYNKEKHIVYNRHGLETLRQKDDIGISSVRAGNIVGEHSIMFTCGDEILTISHTSNSKKIFAKGALNAAEFIINQKPGIYN